MFCKLPLFAALFIFPALVACGVGADGLDGQDELSQTESELALTKGRFETFKGRDGQSYFHLLAGNGQKVLASEGYASDTGAQAGIDTVRIEGALASHYLLREATSGEAYFVLVASNSAVIGVSEMYDNKSNAERAIASVVRIVKNATQEAPAQIGNAKAEVFRGLDSRYYFHVRANNGEIVLQSQGYTARAGANNGVASVATNGPIKSRYELREARDGRFFFVLKAANGRVLTWGETYESKTAAQSAIDATIALLTTHEIG